MTDRTYFEQLPPGDVMVTVAPGEYVLGDPCYTVPEDLWVPLLQSAEFFIPRAVGAVESGGVTYQVMAFGTKYGDGLYHDQYGQEYAVDAGLIGLVPLSLVSDENRMALENRTGFAGMGQIVRFDQSTRGEARNQDGLLCFNHAHLRLPSGNYYDSQARNLRINTRD